MFQFEISNYDNPLLDEELAELMTEYLESASRDRLPGLWKLTDSLNTYAQKGSGREKRKARYNLFGGIICFMGTVLLIFGITPPLNGMMIMVGVLEFFVAAILFTLANKKRPSDIPDICRQAAAEMLTALRQKDWTKITYSVTVEMDKNIITSEQGTEVIACDRIGEVYTSEHLLMFTFDEDKCLVLQKKDLIAAEGFEKVVKDNDRG